MRTSEYQRDGGGEIPEEGSWRQRLYDCYVSSGQWTGGDAGTEAVAPEDVGAFRNDRSAASFIAKNISRDHGIRIVDLGCGYGAILHSLWRAGYRNIAGVDMSGEQVAFAHRLGMSQVEHGGIDEFLSRTPDSSIDVVLLIDVLEHMTRDHLFRTLDQVVRILRSGGRCIAHVPNGEGLYGMSVRYGDLTHELAFTRKSAYQVFTAVGFSEVTSCEDSPDVHGVKSLARRILWDLGTIYHRLMLIAETGRHRGFLLTQNMFVVAVK
jgi:SAM-dependent methyltransferase